MSTCIGDKTLAKALGLSLRTNRGITIIFSVIISFQTLPNQLAVLAITPVVALAEDVQPTVTAVPVAQVVHSAIRDTTALIVNTAAVVTVPVVRRTRIAKDAKPDIMGLTVIIRVLPVVCCRYAGRVMDTAARAVKTGIT